MHYIQCVLEGSAGDHSLVAHLGEEEGNPVPKCWDSARSTRH